MSGVVSDDVSENLRVAIDVSAIPKFVRGAGRYVVELVRALEDESAMELSLIARRDDGSRWTELGANPSTRVHAVAPKHRPTRLLWGEWGLSPTLRRLRPPAKLLFGPHYTMPARTPVPCVVTVHDLTLIEHPEWHERSKVLVFRRALRRAARDAAGIIFVSEYTKARFEEHFTAKGQSFVIPHAVDRTTFSPTEPSEGADAEVLFRLGLTSPYVLAVGTIEPRKNHTTLVAAFARLAAELPELSLVIAGGKGWASAELERTIQQSPVSDRITMVGFVSDSDLAALYRHAALSCYASLDEGFGIPALEALSCGTTLVTTANGAMAEFAGDAAVVVSNPLDAEELAEAMQRAVIDNPDRRHLGIEIAQRFTWARSAGAHVQAFLSVADQ